MAKKFEVGKHYSMHSPCDQDCIWTYKVIARTASTITLQDEHGEVKKCRVKESPVFDAESCTPLGRYSMSPILTAEKTVEDKVRKEAFDKMKLYAEELAKNYGLETCKETVSTFWGDFGSKEYTYTHGNDRNIRVQLRSRFGNPRIDFHYHECCSCVELATGRRPTGKKDKNGYEEYEHDLVYRPNDTQAWGAGGVAMLNIMWQELSHLIHEPSNEFIGF